MSLNVSIKYARSRAYNQIPKSRLLPKHNHYHTHKFFLNNRKRATLQAGIARIEELMMPNSKFIWAFSAKIIYKTLNYRANSSDTQAMEFIGLDMALYTNVDIESLPQIFRSEIEIPH